MAYARPTALLSPGDIFPEIPFTVGVAPLKVARPSGYNPPAGRGPTDFRRIFTLPQDLDALRNNTLSAQQGEQTIAHTRVSKALFLTWGSEVESTLRTIEHQGRVGNRSWLAVPIYELNLIPENSRDADPETGELVSYRDLIQRGRARDNFYLPPFPTQPGVEHYAELRKITPIGVQYFRDALPNRIVTLTVDTLNEMYSQLLWSLTRAQLFFRPIQCECGRSVPIDIRFHGQNFDAEPY